MEKITDVIESLKSKKTMTIGLYEPIVPPFFFEEESKKREPIKEREPMRPTKTE